MAIITGRSDSESYISKYLQNNLVTFAVFGTAQGFERTLFSGHSGCLTVIDFGYLNSGLFGYKVNDLNTFGLFGSEAFLIADQSTLNRSSFHLFLLNVTSVLNMYSHIYFLPVLNNVNFYYITNYETINQMVRW